MKRTLAMLLASLFVLQMIPSAVFADTAAQVPEVRNVVTVSFGGDEYIFADGYTMEILPEAEERERYIFDGWYDGDAKIEAPFTPKGDMVLEARYVHRGTLIAESGYIELWYTGDADVLSVTAVKALLPEGEEQLEAYIFAPASAAEVDIEFKASGRLYALDDSGAAAADLGRAEAGTGMTVSPQTVRGYCLAKAAEEKEAALVLSGKSGSGNVVLSVEKTEYAPALTSSSGEKVTEYETLYAASFAVTDGRGTPTRASAAVSYTDGAVLKAAVAGKRILVLKDGEEIPFEIENDTLTFALSGQGRVGIYAFDDIVSWTWGQAPAAPGTRTAKSAAAKAGEYRMSMSGMMPWGTSAAVETRKAVIPGEEVLYAAEFTLYNAYGYEIEPGNGPVQVTVAGAGIGEAESLRVFRVEGKETREITGVTLEGDRVTFEADAAGLYAVTETLEQIVSIGGATYKITVAYGRDAMIPVGAELDVKEVSGDKYIADTAAALEVGEDDDIFYTKFLDISIVADGKVIEPRVPVQVTVELLDAEEGAEALEVVHFGDRGAEKVDAAADADGRVTFEADSFSTYGFGSVLRALLSWSSDSVTYTLQGFSALLAPAYTAVTVDTEEGLEALGAYRVDSLLGSLLNMIYVKVSAPVALGERESVAVYSVKDGEVADLLSEGTESGSVALGGAEGFAVVKDTGYRNLSFDLGDVTLSGMMPKAAEVEAEGADADALAGLEGEVLGAWDISILENGADYQPDGEHPVDVSIALPESADGTNLHVWHIRDDGTTEEIADFAVAYGRVVFTAPSFSVYAVTENTRTYIFYSFNEYGEYTQYPFYTDTGETVFSQTVREGETVIVPSNPTNPLEPEATFAGWFVGTADNSNPTLEDEPYDFSNIPEITVTEEVRLYARFTSYVYVIFHDQYDSVTGTFPVAYTVRSETENGSATADIRNYRVVYSGRSNMTFYGWSYTPITEPGSPRDDNYNLVSKISEDTITVRETTHLYPIFKSIYWISFYSGYSGSGATYYPDTYYFDGEGPDSLGSMIPTRNVGPGGAYIFTGWYAGAELEGEENKKEAVVTDAVMIADATGKLVDDFADTRELGISVTDGRIKLTKNVTLYAGWETSGMADYRIVVWKQKASDAEGILDSEKTWDLAEVFIRSGAIGDTVSVGMEYQALGNLENYNAVHEEQLAQGDPNPYDGFTFNGPYSQLGTAEVAADGSLIFHIYYDRTEAHDPSGNYSLTFVDFVTDGTVYDIAYGTPLARYDAVPSSGRDGYTFAGWYADESCTVRAFFSEEEYAAWEGMKVLYDTMPDFDLTVYAGWEANRYIVTIDPNYGAMYAYNDSHELEGTGATWFRSVYGDRIQEYTTVKRDYVESASGTWYYVNHAGDGEGGSVWDDRYTYYTQDPSEATEYTTFAYEPGIYRYAGWYEVKPDGTEEEYDFTKIVDHDIVLKLHWTKVGSYYLQYDAGEGALTGGEDLETVYVELDNGTYMDNAEVVVTRMATPPEGYEFAGWRIRADESGTVYYPGQTFTLLTGYAATVQGKETVYLDAVYTAVPTASIVYHANGGVMHTENIDYGQVEAGRLTPRTGYDEAKGTVTVSNLTNNGKVVLSDGKWLTMQDASFAGWCANKVYDPKNEDAPLLYAGSGYTYRVAADENVDLYAVWQVTVKYHLNKDTDKANWGGTWDGRVYTLNAAGDEYSRGAYLGAPVGMPGNTPVYTGSGNLMFLYWATKDGDNNYTQYDFARPVTSALDLYAVWDEPYSVPVHAVDASENDLVNKDNAWLAAGTASLPVGAVATALNDVTAATYATGVPSGYAFAFAAVHSSANGIASIAESEAAESIVYSAADGCVMVTFTDGTVRALGSGEEIYFVYYQKKTLNISYRGMTDDGYLKTDNITVSSSAPLTTGNVPLGEYDMKANITEPLEWESSTEHTNYAFAIGKPGAGIVSQLMLVTNASGSDEQRPSLQVRNTWRGFQYSVDGGTNWINGDYDIELYVIYYQQKATVVTLFEETVGFASDMEKTFTFNFTIDQSEDSGNTWETVYSGESEGYHPVNLKNGEAHSFILLSEPDKLQRVTVTQTETVGFTTTAEGDTIEKIETSPLTWRCTASADSTAAKTMTFTNTRASVPVEVHVAVVDVSGSITLRDIDWRSNDAEKYRFDLGIGDTADFTSRLLPAALLTDDIDDIDEYAFGAVFYGTDNGDDVTVGEMGVVSVAYSETGKSGVYETVLLDSEGSTLTTDIVTNKIYYLYYPKLHIRYMEETAGGTLTEIKGANGSENPTYEGEPLELEQNGVGVPVTQDQGVEVPQDGLTIAQTVGSFRMPPLLDRWDDDAGTLAPLYLVYSKIGMGDAGKTSTEEIRTSEDMELHIRIVNNALQWSFDGAKWFPFSGTPTVYAIYRERGYDLTITKTVPVDTGFNEPFTVTVTSHAINRSSYSVEGLGSSTISATPRSGDTPGSITFNVTDGSAVTLNGMAAGSYTITESGHDNFELSAQVKVGNLEAEAADVTDNSRITLLIDGEARADLTNTPVYICQIGNNKFFTLTAAVEYIRDNSADFSGTIEMLVDYVMPSSDAPEIPDYMNVTLTTADTYVGSGAATITRRSTFTSGAMLTNCGSLTLENITLDGNGVSTSSAIIDNEGTLTITDGATLQGGKGSAVNSWAGTVTVSGGSITGNSAENGGAIRATGGNVVISGGTIEGNSAENGGAVYYDGSGTVIVSGGSIEENSAENGGAVYVGTGSLAVSGGSMGGNTASGLGGAVYAANATVEIGGGTVSGNTASGGGAVYADAGLVGVSGGAVISENTASSGNGGAVAVNTAGVNVSGGSITGNTSTAGSGGGIFAKSGAVTVSGGSMTDNTAHVNGGGICAESGAVSMSGTGTRISGNTAEEGNGGGVYAGSGAVTANSVSVTGNAAPGGNGGGLWTGTGATALTNATFTSNSAINGAAVFTDTGSVTFSAGNVTGNTAAQGGAVGVGSTAAKLYFSGNVKITGNTMDGNASNVYLDQDSDAVINATGLGSGASIGIYVPDKDVTVTDITGATSTENLFDRRGVPGAFFGTYTSENNVGLFSNDRLPGLTVQMEKTSKRLYWGKAFTVEVRYLESFSGCFPTMVPGTVKKIDNQDFITYYAPSSSNAASEIADDLRTAHTIDRLSESAVFGVAFVGDDRTFDQYITDVKWNSTDNCWNFIKRDGTPITGDKLVVYFTEPAYISIENNTDFPLTVGGFTVAGQNVINSNSQAGYGYIFAKNGVIQSKLRPVTAEDMIFAPGKSIRILIPGGKNAVWSLSGAFSGAEREIPYSLTGGNNPYTLTAADAPSFSLPLSDQPNKTLNTNGGAFEIVFGSGSAICKIVTEMIPGVTADKIAGSTAPDADGKVEYTFSTLKQAVEFVTTYMSDPGKRAATIEMLVDYLIPGSDVVTLPAGYDFTFTTATSGIYRYSDDSDARATISRAQGNDSSFITVGEGNHNTTLTVKNLVFDGKNFGGAKISGGIIRTKHCDVIINNVDFNNCRAQFGGGIFIEDFPKGGSIQPQDSLTVIDSNFNNCTSTYSEDKYGGGAIWTSVKDLTISGCHFTSCQAVRQAGAVFHYVGGNYDTLTKVDNCTFEGCSAQAAGSLESGAKTVEITRCAFRNSTATERNGGAVNVWALDSDKTTVECHVTLADCTFENCYALKGTGTNGNGGAMRSTATHNVIRNCTFTNTVGNDGGAINIYNENAVKTEVSGCSFSGCEARNRGGAIFCRSKELIVDGDNKQMDNCSAAKAGGGICHERNVKDSLLSVSGMLIENCSSKGEAGGGVYSTAQTVVLNGVTVRNCTSPKKGGGVYILPGDKSGTNRSATVTYSTIQGNKATGDGGGLYFESSNGSLTFAESTVKENTSGGMGGGVYTNCTTASFTNSSVKDNTASGSGGGVCHNYNAAAGTLTLDGTKVTGNTSGGKGGGVYTLASAVMRNGTEVSGNRLSTNVLLDAAGFYMADGRTLTIGTENADKYDSVTVRENYIASGAASSLRLPMKDKTENSDSVRVLCGLDGEIRVVNAKVRGTQFGHSEIVYPYGVSDMFHVFRADDDSLYGIINRQEASGQLIIWAGDPICKITDDKGRLLYLDTAHTYPAVFDNLDDGTTDTSKTSPFGILRAEAPELYTADGTLYTGSTYQVKMLVENYTATKKITTPNDPDRTIIFTTAGSTDSLYPYRGRKGTRSTITAKVGNNALVTARSNLTMTNIVLDGGSQSGVTANNNTRIISASTDGIRITLGRNAALQNAAVKTNGGGVLLENGASLSIEGGTIRNCSATKNGGGVSVSGSSSMTMSGGTITRCSASGNGGGVYYEGDQSTNMILSGGSISRNSAKYGGGVYLTDGRKMEMSGGSITANTATTKGGGVAVGGNGSRMFFSGAAYVYGNTCSASVAPGNACNVEMDRDFNRASPNPETLIVSRGLTRGATIGVYVPGEDHNNNDGGSLYDKFGDSMDPFGTYVDGTSTDGFHYFVNDRNGMKGGMLEDQTADDHKVYWREIYTLEVTKQVLSDAAGDADRDFRFKVTLTGRSDDGRINANEFSGTFENMTFENGYTEFTLKDGETKAAVNLPLGFGYRVEEDLSADDQAYFTTVPSLVQTGTMSDGKQYVYSVTFTNIHAICKITDKTYGLLYYKSGENYVPAVYSKLLTAFNHLKTQTLYYMEGDSFHQCPTVNTANTFVEMLVGDYAMEEATTFQLGTKATLTTADPNAIDGFPYVGSSETAVIRRGYDGASMISVWGDLTLGNITLDGGSENERYANTDGGVVSVVSGGILTAGNGSTIRNSRTTQAGAGVYLAEGGRMNVSGNPLFQNNWVATTETDATNGNDAVYASGTAEQDIYIDGYSGVNATSLYVTGNMTGQPGSIWVWASDAPHHKQRQQFAVMQGGTRTGLNVFRNARTDADTDNPLNTDPLYLYGVPRKKDGYVYWSGCVELTVEKTVTGDMGDITPSNEFTFTMTVAGAAKDTKYPYTRTTAAETINETLTLDENSRATFTLAHDENIVIKALPPDTTVTVTEAHGYYRVIVPSAAPKNMENYAAVSDAGSTNGATFTLSDNATLTVENNLPAVSPTGVTFQTLPFLILLAAGLCLMAVMLSGKRKKEGPPEKGGGAA